MKPGVALIGAGVFLLATISFSIIPQPGEPAIGNWIRFPGIACILLGLFWDLIVTKK
jgi:hypothetical protein